MNSAEATVSEAMSGLRLFESPDRGARALGAERPEIDGIGIENLSVAFGRTPVLDGVCLRLPRNAVTALIGPSGCGKSTLLQCLNRLSDLIPGCKVSGKVHFGWLDNARLQRDTTLLRREVGMLFQRPNPFPFTLWRNLDFPLAQHGVRCRDERAGRIRAALEEVGLWREVADRLHGPATALSGGQQQRLCLARALVLQPSVLLMDEPCSALDPISTQRIEELILQLAQNRTIVLVTHSVAQARRVSDEVALLWKHDAGSRVVEHGTADAVFGDPQHELTQRYLRFA
ncbi:MAG: phosphate ABC transporter ATP-binding protein [Rubrivivax sp.]|nr:phosphate ABC transporter ATP-binding protein [Rubrivivax sp.]